MPDLPITRAALDAIGEANGPLFDDAVQQPDGSYTITIEADTAAKLDRLRRPNETDSECILRIVRAMAEGRHRARAMRRR